MTEIDPGFVVSQLEGLEPTPPIYDYDGLTIPSGLEIYAVFGSHEDKGDAVELRQRLKSGDVIVIESVGWVEELPRRFQKLSRGDYKTRERWIADLKRSDSIQSQWAEQTVRALYATNKPIIIADIPASHPLFGELKDSMDRPEPRGTFAEAILENREQQLEYAGLNLQRERFMLRSFVEQINGLLESNPKLQQKLQSGDGVKIQTIDFGLVHAGLFEGIKEVARRSGTDIVGEVTFDRGGASYHSQIVGLFNRGLEVSDELIAKELLCKIVVAQLFEETPTLGRIEAEYIAMQQLDCMSLEELEELYQRLT